MNQQSDSWRSLDELADTPEFRDFLEGEFPQAAAHLPDEGVDRRRFLALMAASLGLGGLAGCRRPVMEILPYAKKPEEVVPGLPTFYATMIPRPGGGFPVLVESHEGRPTKIEGHPKHPHSLGKTDTFAQSAILDLYDPDRSTEVLHDGEASSWKEFDSAAHFATLNTLGDGLRFLTEDVTSPALRMLLAQFPAAGWHVWEPLGQENAVEGTRLAFGKPMVPEYRLDRADVIVTLDADLFGLDDNAVSHIRGYSANRLKTGVGGKRLMSRLYVVENQLSVTGAMADNRLPMQAGAIQEFAHGLDSKLRGSESVVATMKTWIEEVAKDLKENQGRCLVVAGPRQPARVHALAAQMNATLGNNGKTVLWRERPETNAKSLKDLTDAMGKKEVNTLIILGGNPVYNAPVDLDFAATLAGVTHSVHLSPYADETSAECTWHLPMSHFLEVWGDCETFDGTYTVVQPLIAPLHVEPGTQLPRTRSALELLAELAPAYRGREAYGIVRESFTRRSRNGDEKVFRSVLHGGFLPGSERKLVEVQVKELPVDALDSRKTSRERLELSIHGDYRVLDGRFTNNGWLQETPDPVSKLTWDNAALISPATADDLQVQTGDIVSISAHNSELEIPVFVQPGQASKSISIHLGYGRSRTGRVSKNAGFNAYGLRTSDALWFTSEVEVKKTGRKYTLASTQNHGNMTERSKLASEARRVDELARSRDLPTFVKEKEKENEEGKHGPHALPLITHPALDGQYKWGMVIDLTKCVGCNACQVACQAENNVPIVGKGEILRGREMYWIRIDRYYTGKESNPEVVHQPVACVHCESAPCETVCPVNAAVHSPEGLNVQVYNRCIGTRYCANNCPYKVRRFNWFDFHQRPLDELRLGPLAPKGKPETLKMQMNPDVTVRMRGVMEKCTYCVQRIERAKIGAKVADPTAGIHPLLDDDVMPACAQACPASAIIFGDLNNKKSRVVALKQDERHYTLLESVGTKPRTTYLLRLRNPNPKLDA